MFVIQRNTIPELFSKSSVDKGHMRGLSCRTVAMEEWAQERTQKGVWPSLSFAAGTALTLSLFHEEVAAGNIWTKSQ